jgi:hypothetical protein
VGWVFILASCGTAQKVPTIAQKPALTVTEGEKPRPMALVAVRVDIGRDRVVGKIGSGAFCPRFDGFSIDITDIKDPELPRIFAAESKQAGYHVLESSSSIFESDNNAELLVGATIVKMKQNLCVPEAGAGGRYFSESYLNIK